MSPNALLPHRPAVSLIVVNTAQLSQAQHLLVTVFAITV